MTAQTSDDMPKGGRTEDAFAGGPELDSIEEARAAAEIEQRLFGSGDPVELGRFRVLERLGEGGMGVVYAAWDPELERRVAIKVVRSSAGGDDARKRLVKEARAAARLSHPNVVAVHDTGVADGRVFIAMEFVDGQNAAELVAARPPRADVMEVFMQAGRGLWAAHQAGLVHRDFKPANVLVSRDEGGHLRAQVGDFGLASLTQPSSGDPTGAAPSLTTLTRAGAVVGTPAYMSPEQHMGMPADTRSDQFSYCVALFEALHGQRPFEGNTRGALREHVLSGEVSLVPSTGVPRRIQLALLRGLSVDPEARFEDMGALLDALREPVARRKWLLGAGVLVAGAAVAIALTRPTAEAPAPCTGLEAPWDESVEALAPELDATLAASKAPAAATLRTSVAEALAGLRRDWVDARGTVCRATKVTGHQSEVLLDARMACLDQRRLDATALLKGLVAADGDATVNRTLAALQGLDDATLCVNAVPGSASPLPEDPAALEERLRFQESFAELRVAFLLFRWKEGRENARAVVAEARKVGKSRYLAPALGYQVAFESRGGDTELARAAGDEGLQLAVRTRQLHAASRIAAALVWLEGYIGSDLKAAERIGGLAVAWAHARGSDAAHSVALDNLGIVAYQAGDFALAVERHRKALEVGAQYIEGNATAEIRLNLNLAAALVRVDSDASRAEARERLERSMALAERALGRDHPIVGGILQNLFAVSGTCEDPSSLERALRIKEANNGPEAATLASTLVTLANCAAELGEYDDAFRRFARAVEIRKAKRGPLHRSLETAYFGWGIALFEAGDYEEAERKYARTAEVVVASHGEDAPQLHRVAFRRAQLRAAAGDLSGARARVEQVLATSKDHAREYDFALYRFALAQLLYPEEPDRALALAREARVIFAARPKARSERERVEEWLASPRPWAPPARGD